MRPVRRLGLAGGLAALLSGSTALAQVQVPPQPAQGGQPTIRRMRAPDIPPPTVSGEAATVAMQLERAMPVVEVMIGGRGPYRFGIDTGAQGHGRIDADLAAELNLPVVGEMTAGDGSGRTQVRRRFGASELSLGAVTYSGVQLTELPRFAGTEGIRGILGLQLFAGQLLTLDYRGRLVSVGRGSLPTTAMPYSGAGTIEVALRIGDESVAAQIDTGNSISPLLIPADLAARLSDGTPPRAVGRASTAVSTVQIMEVTLRGPVHLGATNLPITSARYPTLGNTANLGSLALSSGVLQIDQRNRRLQFTPGTGASR